MQYCWHGHYWRSKHGNEVDFVLAGRGQPPVAIECKWSAAEFDPTSLRAFRNRYPKGPNYVVSADVDSPLPRRYGTLAVRLVPPAALVEELVRPQAAPRQRSRG